MNDVWVEKYRPHTLEDVVGRAPVALRQPFPEVMRLGVASQRIVSAFGAAKQLHRRSILLRGCRISSA